MSLNWDCTKVKGWDGMSVKLRDAMIWGSMFIDMGHIRSVKDAIEFNRRLVLYNETFGPFWYLADKVVYMPSLTDITNCIGFSTNVYTTSRAAFRAKVMRRLEKDADAIVYELERKAKVPASPVV